MLETFQQALRLPTISGDIGDAPTDNQYRDEFVKLHELIQRSFPLVHKTLKREVINELSLLYTWQGRWHEWMGWLVDWLAHWLADWLHV
jgi:hypothetical protein